MIVLDLPLAFAKSPISLVHAAPDGYLYTLEVEMGMKPVNFTKMSLLLVICCSTAMGGDAIVNYPDGYRSWQHVKSMIIQPGHPLEDPFAGIHHIYANSKAMSGLSSGKYEEGAVFVFDLLNYVNSDQVIVEADRKRLDVMQYNPDQFSATRGWGYETFVGDSRTERWEQDVVTACYACHIPAKASNYVYSQYRP